MIGYIFTILLFGSFLIRIARAFTFHASLWQRKEYRWDRMVSYLKTPQGTHTLFGISNIVKWVLIAIFPLFALFKIPISYFFVVTVVFILEAGRNLYTLYKNSWPKARVGIRTLTILLIGFFCTLLLLWWSPLTIPLWILVVDRLLPFILGGLFLASRVPFAVYESFLVRRAQVKIQSVKPLVIGITGSYGKTSTKEFLYSILAPYRKTVKTARSRNTLIGVAETILHSLPDDTEVFIVEMGAYKRGEIASICNLVEPKIAIITGINEQHVELFGSKEEIIKTKYELIENLLPDGTALFNGRNEDCRNMAQLAKKNGKKVIIYTVQKRIIRNQEFIASGAGQTKKDVRFFLVLQGERKAIEVPVFGIHQVENILGAATAASVVGLSEKEIFSSLASLSPSSTGMKKIKSSTGITWIDDSFNSNPDAVRSVLEFMTGYKGKKLLVLQPLIELGKLSESIHEQLGKEAAKADANVILTNQDFFEAFSRGFESMPPNKDNRTVVLNSQKTAELIHALQGKDDIVVFEGKEAGRILHRLLL